MSRCLEILKSKHHLVLPKANELDESSSSEKLGHLQLQHVTCWATPALQEQSAFKKLKFEMLDIINFLLELEAEQ